MLETSFTRLVGCTRPIQLAPIGGKELVAAVCEAGGLGMVDQHYPSPRALEATLDALGARTRGPFGVNFLMPFLDESCLAVAARKARVLEFFYAEPDAALVEKSRAGGALVAWQVGSLAEAHAAEAAGCDFVVVQGCEAGGHVRGTVGLLPLLSRAVEQLRVPVVAAGGIATARDVAAVIACGASGARVGTRFLASHEANAHPSYVAALLAARAEDTILTTAFGADWPGAPHRVLRSAVAAAERCTDDLVGEVRMHGEPLPVARFSSAYPTRDATGRVDAMCLYAGESVANVDAVKPAREIVRELCDGAEALLRSGAQLVRS
jgi:NAD(P)H-dependent flavin oxidoreductase YrpB (nitropropane dioxygenase family)